MKFQIYSANAVPGGRGGGISVFSMDAESGALTSAGFLGLGGRCLYLDIDWEGMRLYASGDADGVSEGECGVVHACRISRETGLPELINSQPTGGASACFVEAVRGGNCVLVANYRGTEKNSSTAGSLAVFPLEKDGSLREASQNMRLEGSGPNLKRQTVSHPHSFRSDPSGRYALAPDLGTDKLMVYKLNAAAAKLAPNNPPFVKVKSGSGPRHLAFHPNGRHAYLINELDSTITAFDYDGARGAFKEMQTVSCLPEGFSGESTAADIHVHPSGRFLYGSNRGHDSIAVFAVDSDSGRLSSGGFVTEGIKIPRGFTVDPTGKFVVVANQGGNDIRVFRIDIKTGGLLPTSQKVDVPAPVCVKITQDLRR